jgi:hypothetical protein
MKIIKSFNVVEETDVEEDPLFRAINGGGDNE